MKPKLELLFRFLGYSFLLFVLGHHFFQQYASTVADFLNVQDPRYQLPANIQKYLLTTPMLMIAFVSLVLSTPGMPAMKKAGLISSGIFLFCLTDVFFIQYLKGAEPLTDYSMAPEVYFCVKWLLPFLLWILPNYARLGEFFRPGGQAGSRTDW